MPSIDDGPGALAGAVEAGIKSDTGRSDTTIPDPRILAITAELLEALNGHQEFGAYLDRRLVLYAALDPIALPVIGGYHLPPAPVRLVEGER